MSIQEVKNNSEFYHIFRNKIPPEYGKTIHTNTFSKITYDTPLRNRRENIAEKYRNNFFPDYPSRLHCFYVCKKETLPFWLESLGDTYTIVKVKLTGVIYWLDSYYYDSEEPEKYWNGNIMDNNSVEGLFVGEFISLEDCTAQILKDLEMNIDTVPNIV